MTTTREGTWSDARKDMHIRAKDDSVWRLDGRKKLDGQPDSFAMTMTLIRDNHGNPVGPVTATTREVVVPKTATINIVDEPSWSVAPDSPTDPAVMYAEPEPTLAERQAAHLATLTEQTKAAVDAAPSIAAAALSKRKERAAETGRPAPTGDPDGWPVSRGRIEHERHAASAGVDQRIEAPSPDYFRNGWPEDWQRGYDAGLAGVPPADITDASVDGWKRGKVEADLRAAASTDVETDPWVSFAPATGGVVEPAPIEAVDPPETPAVDAVEVAPDQNAGEVWPVPPTADWTDNELSAHLFLFHGLWTDDMTEKGKARSTAIRKAHEDAGHPGEKGLRHVHGVRP